MSVVLKEPENLDSKYTKALKKIGKPLWQAYDFMKQRLDENIGTPKGRIKIGAIIGTVVASVALIVWGAVTSYMDAASAEKARISVMKKKEKAANELKAKHSAILATTGNIPETVSVPTSTVPTIKKDTPPRQVEVPRVKEPKAKERAKDIPITAEVSTNHPPTPKITSVATNGSPESIAQLSEVLQKFAQKWK